MQQQTTVDPELARVRRDIKALESRRNHALDYVAERLGPSYVARIYREIHAEVAELRTQLLRLVHMREQGDALVAEYEQRLVELRDEVTELKNRDAIARLMRLMRQLNELGIGAGVNVDPVIEEVVLAKERLVELRGLIPAYESMIRDVRRAMDGAYVDREAFLRRMIDERLRHLADELEVMADPYATAAEARQAVVVLRAKESELSGRGQVAQLLSALDEVAQLAKELGADRVRYALE